MTPERAIQLVIMILVAVLIVVAIILLWGLRGAEASEGYFYWQRQCSDWTCTVTRECLFWFDRFGPQERFCWPWQANV